MGQRLDDVKLDDVVLVVSELVANGVLHGLSPLVFRLHLADEMLTVSVDDRGAGTDFEQLPAAPVSTRGRGLTIVDQLADRWGVEPTSVGKSVWATFDVSSHSL